MKVDLAGLLRNAAKALRKPDPRHRATIAFGLEEAADHVEQVRAGDATLAEFCALYSLPKPPGADLGTVMPGIPFDSLFVEQMVFDAEQALVPYEIKDGDGRLVRSGKARLVKLAGGITKLEPVS